MRNTNQEKMGSQINNLVLVLVIAYCCYQIRPALTDQHITLKTVAMFLSVAIVVNFIKIMRLYVILIGMKYEFKEYVRAYSLTSMLNYIIPYKMGEIYRGYCLGGVVNSYLNGYTMVLFDRFVDTLGLVTVVMLLGVGSGFQISTVYLMLEFFLAVVILGYVCFPSLYSYWNHFLIYNKHSERTLKGLSFLKICNEAYCGIKIRLKGRIIVTYVLSVFAWMIEISVLYILKYDIMSNQVGTYLLSLLSGRMNFDDNLYLYINFLLLLFVEILLLLDKGVRKRWK